MSWLLTGNYGSLKTLGQHTQIVKQGVNPINKESNIQPKKKPFKNEGEIRTFSNKKQFIASRSVL